MIWLNIKKLEKEISENRLSDNEGFYYLLATTIYGFVYYLFSGFSGYNIYTFLNLSIAIIITLIGLPIAYKTNSQKGNIDFFKRFIAITWVVRMRLLIFTIIFMFICMNIFDLRNPSTVKDVTFLLFSILINVMFYGMTISSFKNIKTN